MVNVKLKNECDMPLKVVVIFAETGFLIDVVCVFHFCSTRTEIDLLISCQVAEF